MRSRLAVTLVACVALAACADGGTDEPSASPTTVTSQDTPAPTPTPTATATATASSDPAPPPSTPAATTDDAEGDAATTPPTDGSTEADTAPDDTRSAEAVALARARQSWSAQDGRLYVWSYREEGEGLVDEFCVEGVVGAGAGDAAACPFEASPGGRSVESWHDTIAAVLTGAAPSGRTVSVSYDESTGHPLEMVFAGGEIDGLLVTTTSLTLQDDVDEPTGDLLRLTAACAERDPDACFFLGVAGGPLPDALVTGNELTQAPDLDVLDRCGVGEPAACHEVGLRGLAGD